MGHIREEVKVIESGANDFKLLEFSVGEIRQGINILKIYKIIKYCPADIRPIFNSESSIAGILNIENTIISIIDLHEVFQLKNKANNSSSIIITEFNQEFFGFVVDDIVAVHKISWKNLRPINDSCPSDLFVSVATINGKEILLTDFETVVEKVSPGILRLPREDLSIETDTTSRRKCTKIICADDSKVIRLKLKYIFDHNHFDNVTIVADGQDALDLVIKQNSSDNPTDHFTFMITDIEMPKMNGLTLCREIKNRYPHIPVLILSSLV
ncbi:MAG: hypothetical protein A2451_14795, partial [Bdellovibrionales bacterium RIFOXYC2_FULL_39_8]